MFRLHLTSLSSCLPCSKQSWQTSIDAPLARCCHFDKTVRGARHFCFATIAWKSSSPFSFVTHHLKVEISPPKTAFLSSSSLLLFLLAPQHNFYSQLSREAFDVSLTMDHFIKLTLPLANTANKGEESWRWTIFFYYETKRAKWQTQNEIDLFLQKCLHLAKLNRMMRVSQLKIINQIIPLYLLRNAQKFIRISIFKQTARLARLRNARSVRTAYGIGLRPEAARCVMQTRQKQHLSVKQMRCLHCDLFK